MADLAANLMWSGRTGEAEAVAREALEGENDPALEARQRACLAQTLVTQGRTADSLAQLQRAIDSEGIVEPDRLRLRAWAAHVYALAGDLDGARRTGEEVCADAGVAGDDFSLCLALNTLSMVEGIQGRASEAVRLGTQAVERADATPGRHAHRFHHSVMLGSALLDADRLSEGFAVLQRGRAISEEIGAAWNLPFFHNALTAYHFFAGQWDEAIAEYETGILLADAVEGRQGLASVHGVRCLLALHRNDLDGGRQALATAVDLLAQRGPQFRFHWVLWARALMLEADGELVGAERTLAEVWDGCEEAGAVGDLYLFAPDLVRLSLANQDRDRAEQTCEAAVALAQTLGTAAASTAALRARAMLDGDPELGLAALGPARESPRPLELALACEEAAASLARAGRVDEARPLFEEAIDGYDRLEAGRNAARAAAAMRSIGLRRGARGPRRRPHEGWGSLTPAERKVAELVAQGLTNREIGERLFISRYTARTHVSHALAKLGLRSRVELAAEAAKRS
jgi:DNA-binding CsgD family transcriptional regulator